MTYRADGTIELICDTIPCPPPVDLEHDTVPSMPAVVWHENDHPERDGGSPAPGS